MVSGRLINFTPHLIETKKRLGPMNDFLFITNMKITLSCFQTKIMRGRIRLNGIKKENLIYCYFLEHLLLHVLIVAYPSKDKNEGEDVGIGGFLKHIVFQLNDFYSGYISKLEWQNIYFKKVKDQKEVYFNILRRFVNICSKKE